MDRYSLKQCQALLGGIDFKTLQRWMKKADIEAEQAKNDERFKYLTREQLEQLAGAHERDLSIDGEATHTETPISHTTYKLLLDRLLALEEWQAIQQDTRAEIEDFREQIPRLTQQVDELAKRTEGITLLLEERRRLKIAEDSQLENRLSDLKLQLDVVQSQANSFTDWYSKLQRAAVERERDIQTLHQAVQAIGTALPKQANRSSKSGSRQPGHRSPAPVSALDQGNDKDRLM